MSNAQILSQISTAKINSWSVAQQPANGILTYTSTITWDATLDQVATITLDGNATMDLPSNIINNASYVLIVKQDATGARTLAWNSAFKFTGGIVPTLSTSALAVDVFTFVADGTTALRCIGKAYDVK